uniref:Uncharacterized protein n=1 Tax=Anguilla anguilla TaxID=7936 RepID=A0A0E9V6F3_ANGAN
MSLMGYCIFTNEVAQHY